MGPLVQPLAAGSLDIVGDIHGEIDALRALLAHLGYAADGTHHADRRLVFVGDLCDRGPDSVAVVALVQSLVEAGRAQCIAGNHELNILRGDHKHGNRWLLDPTHRESATSYASRTATQTERAAITAFFRTLPLALERDDLRVVHATWHTPSLETLRASTESNIDTFTRYEEQMKRTLAESGLLQAGKDELAPHEHALADRRYPMPNLTTLGRLEEQRQLLNPVRVVTSGPERATAQQFFSTGKWRFCDRVRWWDEYTDAPAVVFGHYWRGMRDEDKPDLFEGITTADWLGPNCNAYCVDFSVGRRFLERKHPERRRVTRLAALQWPERTCTFDDGDVIATTTR